MPSEKVIQLRQQLADRIPGLRVFSEGLPEKERSIWPTGLPQIDGLLQGGFPKSAISEIVADKANAGSALLSVSLLRHIAENGQILTLIDGQDSFDPASCEPSTLSRLLWVRCKSAEQALKAADLILRDRNLPVALLDLRINPAAQLRKIPSSTWYRFQRIVEVNAAVFIVLTPMPLVGSAQVRLRVHSRFGLEALDQAENDLVKKLKVELAHHRLHVAPSEQRATG